MAFNCSYCYLFYEHRSSLLRHIKAAHPSRISARSSSHRLNCNVCSASFDTKIEFNDHISSVHDLTVSEATFTFSSLDEFSSWKVNVEQENCVFYKKSRGTQFNKNASSQRTVFICNRSGHFSSEGKGIRHLGSIKVNGYCPSEIKLKVKSDGECTVQFVETHWGHEREIINVADRRSKKREHLLTEVCSSSQITENNALASAKERLLTSLKKVSEEIENSSSIEEISAAQELVDAILPTVFAVRESSKNLFPLNFDVEDNSKKRKKSCKKSKTAVFNGLSEPNFEDLMVFQLSHEGYEDE